MYESFDLHQTRGILRLWQCHKFRPACFLYGTPFHEVSKSGKNMSKFGISLRVVSEPPFE